MSTLLNKHEIVSLGNSEAFNYLSSLDDKTLESVRNELFEYKKFMTERAEHTAYVDGMAIAILRMRGMYE